MIKPGMPKLKAYVKDGKVVDGDEKGAEKVQLDKFSMGGLKGFQMALQDLQAQGCTLSVRDEVTITCTGFKQNSDHTMDDMILFKIEVF